MTDKIDGGAGRSRRILRQASGGGDGTNAGHENFLVGRPEVLAENILVAHGLTQTRVQRRDITDVVSEWGRWRDVERLFGIKRGTLYNLDGDGVIKSVSIRRRGNIHGCRLFYLPSIRAYLHSLLEDQAVEQEKAGE